MQRDLCFSLGGGMCALVFGVEPNLIKEVSAVCVGASQAPAILQNKEHFGKEH